MDPCTELATRVVSYLWALRDVYPDALTAQGIKLDELHEKVGTDMALLARYRSLARRHTSERWPKSDSPAHGPSLAGKVRSDPQFEPLDHRLQQIVKERIRKQNKQQRTTTLEKVTGGLVDGLSLTSGTAERQDFDALRTLALGDFVKHAASLIGLFPSVALHEKQPESATPSTAPVSVTRESMMDEIASEMLERGLLYRVAHDLDYRPLLVRAVGGGRDLLDDPGYPRMLARHCRERNLAVPFQLVLHDELDEIDRSRRLRNGSKPPEPEKSDSEKSLPLARAYQHSLLGLAFSGGGIRSATFNLGILQGLAGKGWLAHFDYLSTVSGGGYIGSWLLAWIKRRGSIAAVQESLRGYGGGSDQSAARNPDPGSEHVRPIRLLREYSNYLAPRIGAFSADSWTIVSIWLRNTVMNLMVLTLFLMAVLIAPRLLGVAFDGSDLQPSMWCVVLFLGLSSWLIGFNLRSFDDPGTTHTEHDVLRLFRPRLKPSERGDTPFIVIATIVVPALITAFFGMRVLWQYAAASTPASDDWVDRTRVVGIYSFLLLAGGLAITAAVGRYWNVAGRGERLSTEVWLKRILKNSRGFFLSVFWGLLAAAVGALLIVQLWKRVLPLLFADSHRGIWIGISFGPVVLLLVVTLVIVIYLGLEGLSAPDERREWWSRLGAWLGLVGGTWAVVTSISFFVPYLVATTWLYASTLGLGWSAITGAGAWLASSGESNGINLRWDKKVVPSLIITAAPYLFVAGVFVIVAVLTHATFYILREEFLFRQTYTAMGSLPFSVQRYADTYWAFVEPSSNTPAVLCVVLLCLSALLSRRADVNEFSMHHFYKNRLVRAYLGASRTRVNRRPNAFTGLDMDDEIKLWRFTTTDVSTPDDERTDCRESFAGPFPIINTTLNMTTGDELAFQERKGQSFVFTPLYSGFDFATKQSLIPDKTAAQFAYRPSHTFGNYWKKQNRAECGVGIGTAVAISGAAANPNAGYHTSPAVAFFLTILNARLGWWIGNPLRDRWDRPSPPFGLFYMLSELFGFAGVNRNFVNLSDGGHFDNMGLYELVRRRCRFIVLCDAEQDDRYSFNGLAGAIRKCRVDFGVVIDIETKWIDPRSKDDSDTGSDEMPPSKHEGRCHVAVGTINYPGEGTGTLVYIKSSLTGDEPADIREYRDSHPEFPHQTTADQFFDESQFESYRALGQHIVDRAFPSWPSGPSLDEALLEIATSIRTQCETDAGLRRQHEEG